MSTGLKALFIWMMAESVSYIISLGAFFFALISGEILLAAIFFGIDFAIIVVISVYQEKS